MDYFCLNWSGHASNIRQYFKKLREEQRMFDVTLATEDGQHIQAHKIILSAGSDLFSNIFMMSNHSNMLVYLKGINSAKLEPVIDFIYNGEAFITEEDLKVFIETGEELQVKGLEGELTRIQENVPDRPRNHQESDHKYFNHEKEIGLSGSAENIFSNNDIFQNQHNIVIKNKFLTGTQVNTKISDSAIKLDENIQLKIPDELTQQINEIIEKNEGFWRCKICGQTTKWNDNLRNHIERKHIEGMSHPCHICQKIFTNRPNLRDHIGMIHSELLTCDICGKTGMNRASYRMHKQRKHG